MKLTYVSKKAIKDGINAEGEGRKKGVPSFFQNRDRDQRNTQLSFWTLWPFIRKVSRADELSSRPFGSVSLPLSWLALCGRQ